MNHSAFDLAVLVLAAFAGGAQNAVAGGGSFLTLPALIAFGVDPVRSNATSTAALWAGSVLSSYAYRSALPTRQPWFRSLLIVSAVGGVFGALLLVGTPSSLFEKLLPFLMLTAALLFTVGPRLTRRAQESQTQQDIPWRWVLLIQIPISLYGGYFGGGMGFLMLAAYAFTLPRMDLHAHNGLKSVLAIAINATALMTFTVTRAVDWEAGIAMACGAAVGGFYGARWAQRFPASRVRPWVAGLGWVLTGVFFFRAYQ